MSKTAVENLRRRHTFKYHLVIEGIFIGLITGAFVSVFRLALTYADETRNILVDKAATDYAYALILAAVLILIIIAITALLIAEPDIAGSGIPQVEAELSGQKEMNWLRVILAKSLGCALAIGGGLALGREGPSIQLGAMVGKGFSRKFKRLLTEERMLITCGAGAGLAAAFGAPLAGAIFALEELHRNFSAEVLLSTMASTTAGVFVSANVFGLTPVFGFDIKHGLPLKNYWTVVIVGICVGFLGIIYNKSIEWMQNIFDKIGIISAHISEKISHKKAYNLTDGQLSSFGKKASVAGKLLVIFSFALVMVFFYSDVLGSGSYLVGDISRGKFALSSILLLLILKFVFSTASFGSGSPGGIFLPLLVLGALTGGSISRLLGIFGFDQIYITALVVTAMAGFFAAVVRAPVTGVILITEMTGDFTCLLPLVGSSLVAYLIAEFFGSEPIYTQLLRRSYSKSVYNTDSNFHSVDRKAVINADVHVGSFMDGKTIADFALPVGTLIVSVLRNGEEIIPDGNTILKGGDELEILTGEKELVDVESIIDIKSKTLVEPE